VPELPDITVYVEHLAQRVASTRLVAVRALGPNLLRTADPPLSAAEGRPVTGVRRLGKRIVFALEGDLFLVLHLMIAGRLHWRDGGAAPGAKPIVGPAPRGRAAIAEFRFERGTLTLTEAGTKKRAGLWLVRGEAALAALDPGGLEPLTATAEQFADRLALENHTLKRSLTDPRLFSGIGNAYSDEILHHARLSPLRLSQKLLPDEAARLFASVRHVLLAWTDRLRAEAGERFPEGVTAFRKGMAVHGRYREPCPACGTAVQRIAYADNETNYCPRCQTEGRLLADRGLSRLLRDDWPRTIEELEEGRARAPGPQAPRSPNKRVI
jgi:formamidopyrimidine-DNA glycosylase